MNAGCDGDHHVHDRFVCRIHRVSVQIEEGFRDDVGRPFIAIKETVIFAKPE